MIFKGLEIQGIYGRRDLRDLVQDGRDAAERPRRRAVITHRFPADEFDEAFEIVDRGECGKVILDWVG